MNHIDHVNLIKKGVEKGGVWADFGSGSGAFTLALRDIAGETVKIYSVDKDESSVKIQRRAFEEKFMSTNIQYLVADFTKPLELPPLDGILMANSLHFVEDQLSFLTSVHKYLKPTGSLLIVEYNYSVGNSWVPYPVSFEQLTDLTEQLGWSSPLFLNSVPSRFMNEIYAAEIIL